MVAGGEVLPAERAVLPEVDRAQEVEAEGVRAEGVGDLVRRDAGELRLGHLLAPDEQPAVAEDLPRHFDTCGHEHGRPDDGVESSDVLADELHGRPAAVELDLVGAVADRGHVVEQRLEPHIDHVVVIPGDLDAPVEARAGDRQVAQPLPHELHDLVAHALRLHEVGPVGVQVEQPLLEVAHAEEVVGLLEDLDRLRMDGAHELALVLARARHELARLLVLLAAHAIVPLELARVDVAVVVELLQEEGDPVLVPRIRRADEVVVGDVDRLEQRLPRRLDELVDPGLRRAVVRDGRAQDLLAVLVGAGEQPGVVAGLAVPAREHVGGDLGVGVADVRHVVHVEDRRRDVEGAVRGHAHHPIPGAAAVTVGRARPGRGRDGRARSPRRPRRRRP